MNKTDDYTREHLHAKFSSDAASALILVKEFATKLAQSEAPNHIMKWSGSTFQAAANYEVAMMAVRHFDGKSLPQPLRSAAELVEDLEATVLRKLTNHSYGYSRSSSLTTNLAEDCELQAYADLYKTLGRIPVEGRGVRALEY